MPASRAAGGEYQEGLVATCQQWADFLESDEVWPPIKLSLHFQLLKKLPDSIGIQLEHVTDRALLAGIGADHESWSRPRIVLVRGSS